jgi:hypothetical protein
MVSEWGMTRNPDANTVNFSTTNPLPASESDADARLVPERVEQPVSDSYPRSSLALLRCILLGARAALRQSQTMSAAGNTERAQHYLGLVDELHLFALDTMDQIIGTNNGRS